MAKGELEVVEKMTLEEYESKYTKRQNTKMIKSFLFILAGSIGIMIFCLLLFLVLRVYDINKYAGYGAAVIALILFIFVYIVPIIKISKTRSFDVNVNKYTAKDAQKHNKKVRNSIADEMIDFTSKTDGVGWYNSELIGKLAIARQTNNDVELKRVLTEIYDKDVKKSANEIIREHAIKIGVITAISQSEKIDTLFVAIYELNLIKQLVFLYGYRPSDAKLMRIYSTVLTNALIAYGLQSVTNNLATGLVQKIGGAMKGIPLLGNAIATVIGSASQGIINGLLTVVIGHQTLKYLKEEYHLQDILDEINLEDFSEEEMLNEVKEDIIKSAKNKIKEKASTGKEAKEAA